MKAEKDYSNANQQTLISVIHLLAQEYFTPKTVQEVADALELSRDSAFRTLWNLEKVGWIEPIGGGYRIAGAFTKLAESARQAHMELIRKHFE